MRWPTLSRSAALLLSTALLTALLTGSNPARATAEVVGAGSTPLILLVDVSGSMDDAGGNGMSKLDGAKSGMKNAVNGRSGNLVGLWTYPSDGNCSAGGYVAGAEPVERQDAAKLKALIGNLSANGGTPTAQALRALGDDLIKRGFQRANIVLVSDGESNCDPPKPPCEVARDLVAEGFDITVNTIGFSISSAGRDELTCIADATHGSYVDVSDSEALIDELQNQVNPVLSLTAVSSPEPVEAGQRVSVTVTASNTSTQQTVTDLSLTLAFRSEGAEDVLLPVVPPRAKAGNLPPEESVSKTWEFALNDLAPANQRGKYRAVAYGRTAEGTFVDGVITIDTSQVEKEGEYLWGVTIDGDDQIAILGDSYSSGQGAGRYEDWMTHKEYASVDEADWCHTSQLTYGHDGGYKIKNLACSGAVMANFEAVQVHGDKFEEIAQPQFGKLASLETAPRIAFMTIGGNDIGFAKIITNCISVKDNPALLAVKSCVAGDLLGAMTTLNTISSGDLDRAAPTRRLARLYQQVWGELNSDWMRRTRVAQGGPEFAPVVVLPYPALLPPTGTLQQCDVVQGGAEAATVNIQAPDVARLNALQGLLNQTIEIEVTRAADGGKYGIFFARGVETALEGHSVCSNADNKSWIVPVTVRTNGTEEAMHPSETGYQAIGRRLRSFLRSEAFSFTGDRSYETVERRTYCQSVLTVKQSGMLQLRQWRHQSNSAAALSDVGKCDYRWFELDGFAPGTAVLVNLHSSPIALASLTADEAGKVLGVIQLPGWIDPGVHQLTVEGIDAEGNPVVHSTGLRIVEPTPWFVWAAGGVAVAALLAGLVFVLLGRRRRKG